MASSLLLLWETIKVSTYSFAVVLVITNQVNSMTGWNIGRLSGKAVAVSWNYIYTMDNYVDLTCLQLGFLIMGTMLISGDFYLSARGLQGFLAKKPVMTFDLPAGIERRTMVMSLWTCSGMMALGYPDVVCLYYGSSAVVWFFVIIFLGSSYYCLFDVILGLVSRIPSPFSHVATISCITMCYTVILLAQLVHVPQLNEMLHHYRSAPFKLGLNISGVMSSSGAYDNANAKSALTFIFPTSRLIILGSILLSIVVST
ncbi:hypothetical protein AC1031_012465 [Aphanomyces cochlioides]|nr:hypothetical protein AC1031_012465 [Aphanomyces cochlioides]